MNVFVLLNTEGDILKNVGTEPFWGTIDFHCISILEVNAWFQTVFRISFFVFSRSNKLLQAWNYLRVSKWWQNFHFWVNYSFLQTDKRTALPMTCFTDVWINHGSLPPACHHQEHFCNDFQYINIYLLSQTCNQSCQLSGWGFSYQQHITRPVCSHILGLLAVW